MNYGLYTIFLGMRSRQSTLEVQANNIANASTIGFKAERLIYSSFEADKKADGSIQNLVAGVGTSSGTNYTEGSVQQTGRNMDVAIEGDGFLQVQTPRGIRYTRAGNLTLNTGAQVVSKHGDLVVGERGPITVSNEGEFSVGQDGTLSVGGQIMDTIKLVRFDNPAAALIKDGDNLFMASGAEKPQPDAKSKLVAGSLEGSNVNTVSEMVAMINNNREFESLEKSVSLLMNDIGRKIFKK